MRRRSFWRCALRGVQAGDGGCERALLADEDLALESFRGFGTRGGRRPFRVPLSESGVKWDDGIIVRSWLPSGAYAAGVLREITKTC